MALNPKEAITSLIPVRQLDSIEKLNTLSILSSYEGEASGCK